MGHDLTVRIKAIQLIDTNIDIGIYLWTIIFIINYYLHNCLFIFAHISLFFLTRTH